MTRMALIVGVGICLATIAGQLIWWALDRKGPYDRIFGVVVPEEGGRVRPGSKVYIQWTVDLHPGADGCYPASSRHVNRTITDANGVHVLPKTENVYGGGRQRLTNPLRRPFPLPEWSVPGPAVYYSEACWICNPLQWAVNWPICISTPDAHYVVDEP